MKRDKEHEEWRRKNDLPADYKTLGDAQRIASRIVEIISRGPERFRWG